MCEQYSVVSSRLLERINHPEPQGAAHVLERITWQFVESRVAPCLRSLFPKYISNPSDRPINIRMATNSVLVCSRGEQVFIIDRFQKSSA